jgi:hypothetical protein
VKATRVSLLLSVEELIEEAAEQGLGAVGFGDIEFVVLL